MAKTFPHNYRWIPQVRVNNKKKSAISLCCIQWIVAVCAFKVLVNLSKSYKSSVFWRGSVEANNIIYNTIIGVPEEHWF